MPFDASKVERCDPGKYGKYTYVRSEKFNACAAALDEVRAEVEKLKGIVREYQNSAIGHWACGNGKEQCFLCRRADEALGGK